MSTLPVARSSAAWFWRAETMAAATALQVPAAGSYCSALARTVVPPAPPTPPATRTLPLGSITAMWVPRGIDIDATCLQRFSGLGSAGS